MALLFVLGVWTLPATGCDDGPGPEHEQGDLEDYCARWTAAWCPAYLECDPFRFGQAFRSFEDCLAHVERDCLDPPGGAPPCLGARPEETDLCVAYIEESLPDGCDRLFGPSADNSPCEGICD